MFRFVLNNAAHNLAVLKDSGTEVSGFGQNFIETYNAQWLYKFQQHLINEPMIILVEFYSFISRLFDSNKINNKYIFVNVV